MSTPSRNTTSPTSCAITNCISAAYRSDRTERAQVSADCGMAAGFVSPILRGRFEMGFSNHPIHLHANDTGGNQRDADPLSRPQRNPENQIACELQDTKCAALAQRKGQIRVLRPQCQCQACRAAETNGVAEKK